MTFAVARFESCESAIESRTIAEPRDADLLSPPIPRLTCPFLVEVTGLEPATSTMRRSLGGSEAQDPVQREGQETQVAGQLSL